MEGMMTTIFGILLILLFTLAILLNSFVLWAFVKHHIESDFIRKLVAAFSSQNLFAGGISLVLLSIWMCNSAILQHPSATCKLFLLAAGLVLVELSANSFVSFAWMIINLKQPLRVEGWASTKAMQCSYIIGFLLAVMYIIIIGTDMFTSNQLSSLTYCSIHLIPFPFACVTLYCIIIPPKIFIINYELYLLCAAQKIVKQDNKMHVGTKNTEVDRKRRNNVKRFVISEILDLILFTVEIVCWCLILHCPDCVQEYQLVMVLSIAHGISIIICLLFGFGNQLFKGPILKGLRDIRTCLPCENRSIDIIE